MMSLFLKTSFEINQTIFIILKKTLWRILKMSNKKATLADYLSNPKKYSFGWKDL